MDYIVDFSLRIQDIPPDAFRLKLLDCQNDGVNQDYVFSLECFSEDSYDIADWGLKKAIIYYQDKPFRYGILTSGKAHVKKFEGYFYEFSVSSPLAFFKTSGPDRVFVNKTPNEIIDSVLANQSRWELKNPLTVLAYRVQYHQSDYDFVMELLADYKLNFIFEDNILKISDKLNSKNMTHHVEVHQHYYSEILPKPLGYDFEKSPRAPTFRAKIEAPDTNSPYINHDGYYFIRFLFDQTSELLHGSLPVPLISPHFMHFPLRNNTEVIVRFINGNINQPLIVGVIPDNDPEPEIYSQKSYAGHECLFTPDKIKLSHGNSENFLELAENSVIQCGLGEIYFRSGQDSIIHSYGNHTQEINQDQQITVKHDQIISAGNILFQSASDISFSAEHELKFNTENMDITGNNSKFTAENIRLYGQESLEINNTNTMNLFGQNIVINTQNNLVVESNGVSIVCTPEGILLNTPVLIINADQISGVPPFPC